MDLEDASEAPTAIARKKDISKSKWLEMVSMLWMTATEDDLQ